MQEKLVLRRGNDTVALREAPALDFEFVKALEVYVVQQSAADSVRAAFAFQCHFMVSMRYDDALHVAPSTVIMKVSYVQATAWQTKVGWIRNEVHRTAGDLVREGLA